MSARDRDRDRRLLLAAVRAAGAVALGYFRTELEQWEKAPGDPVSEADHAVNDLLEARLRRARPGYGWLSEESTDEPARLACERVWVVDPIDGTRAFLRHLPEFTVAVALVEQGRPVLGAVFNPATEEFFEAEAGRGARLNGTPVRVSERASLAGARLIAGRRLFQRAGWEAAPAGTSFASINSIAYRMALIAAGRYDACVSLSEKSDWDIAAGELIVAEAGGLTTTARDLPFLYNGPEPRHDSVIAAGPALHDELMRLLQSVPRPPGATW